MNTRAIALGLGLGLLPSLSTLAVDIPKVEVGLGYQFLHDQQLETNFPAGWLASLNGNVNNWLGLMAEFSGSYKTVDELGSDVNVKVYTFMGGLRFAKYFDRGAAYFQLLGGAARLESSGQVVGASFEASTTKFAFQPGIGLDGRLTDHLRVRIGGDYRLIFTDVVKTNEWRAHAGFVITFGGVS